MHFAISISKCKTHPFRTAKAQRLKRKQILHGLASETEMNVVYIVLAMSMTVRSWASFLRRARRSGFYCDDQPTFAHS